MNPRIAHVGVFGASGAEQHRRSNRPTRRVRTRRASGAGVCRWLWLSVFAVRGLCAHEGAQPLAEPVHAIRTTHDHAGRIVAPVKVNGQGPFRFVVDTGATHSVLSLDLAHKLLLQPDKTASTSVTLSGVTGSTRAAVVTVQSLQVGDLMLEQHRVPVLDAVFAGADGVLGADGLQDMRLTVDFRNDSITIEKSSLRAAPRYFFAIPFEIKFDSLLVANAKVGGVRVKAIIDTGAERTLGNPALRKALRVGLDPHRRPSNTDVEGVTAELQSGAMIQAPTIAIGGVKINQTDVTFGDLHVFKVWDYQRRPALLVGMDVLGVLDVLVIDYARQELQLRPAGTGR
jgi:clan AA aspartic protease (TIGR02281 family)